MSIVKLILHSLVMIFTCTQVCYSASLHLTWNGNTETDLAGYKVYYGTSPGSYGNPVVLGDVTEYELSGLEEGTLYYVALTAFDTSDNESEKPVEESGVAHQPPAGTELDNGIPDGGSVEPQEEDLYHIDIPAGQGYLLGRPGQILDSNAVDLDALSGAISVRGGPEAPRRPADPARPAVESAPAPVQAAYATAASVLSGRRPTPVGRP